MAEAAPERPNDSVTDAVRFDAFSSSDESAVPSLEGPQVYKPLSLLALLALLLGVVCALVVLVGGLIPFYNHYRGTLLILLLLAPILGVLGAVLTRQKEPNRIAAIAAASFGAIICLVGMGGLVAFSGVSPWILSEWAWGLLLGTVLISFIALARIRSAEGSLAGVECARWGLYLSLIFGGYYLLYFAGNQFAVSSQAADFMNTFLERLRNDQVPEAYVLTYKSGTGPVGTNSEELVEEILAAFNGQTALNATGKYTAFNHSTLVQRIRLGGKQTKVQRNSTGIQLMPTGEYAAKVTYTVTNDTGTFDIEGVASSTEANGQRQWQVISEAFRLIRDRPSKMWEQLTDGVIETGNLVQHWSARFGAKEAHFAALLSLPTEHRVQLEKAYVRSRPELNALGGLAPRALAPSPEEQAKLAEASTLFNQKGWLQTKDFKAKANKQEQIRQVLTFLNTPEQSVTKVEVMRISFPVVQIQDKELEVSHPIRFLVRGKSEDRPEYAIDAELVCRTQLPPKSSVITGLRLIHGYVPPPQGGGPPVPKGP